MRPKYLIIALCLLCTTPAAAQSDLFKKFSGKKDVKSFYISEGMFKLISGASLKVNESFNFGEIVDKLQSMQVIQIENSEYLSIFREEMQRIESDIFQRLEYKADGSEIALYFVEGAPNTFWMFIFEGITCIYMEIQGSFNVNDIVEFTHNSLKNSSVKYKSGWTWNNKSR